MYYTKNWQYHKKKKKSWLFWSLGSRSQEPSHTQNCELYYKYYQGERCVVILDYIKGHFELEKGQAGLPWGSNGWAKSWEKGRRESIS